MSRQLPLPVAIPDQMTMDTFDSGANAQLLQHLSGEVIDNPQDNQITFVVGEKASGKSHLLFGLCHLAEQHSKRAVFIDFVEYPSLSPDILDGLCQADIICLDNINGIVAQAAWEMALFNLINAVKQNGQSQLIMTSNTGPQQLKIGLPDLASRLSWGLTFQLWAPTEEAKIRILSQRAKARGMPLSAELSRFIYTHWQRDMHSLMQSLDKLDRLSLEQKRRLTLPFIKQALEI